MQQSDKGRAPVPRLALRQAEQARALGVSRWTLNRIRATNPTFPPERQITPGVAAVLADDFDAWLRSRPIIDRRRNASDT